MTQSTRSPSTAGGPDPESRPLLAPLVDYPEHEFVRRTAAARARDVDTAAASPLGTLRELGARGLLDLGLTGSLAPQAAVVFDLATECTATSGPANSRIRWRHPPHGVPGRSPSVTTTISAIECSPAATIAAIAPASAHDPSGYAAFSTLHPTITAPVDVRIAAPTR